MEWHIFLGGLVLILFTFWIPMINIFGAIIGVIMVIVGLTSESDIEKMQKKTLSEQIEEIEKKKLVKENKKLKEKLAKHENKKNKR